MRGFYKICSIVVFTALLTGCGADKAIKKAEKFYALGEYSARRELNSSMRFTV